MISARDHENKRLERRAKKTTTKKRQKRTREERSYSKRVRAKWFCRPFKLRFHQLRHKAYLNFKSNLYLALLVILKHRELYEYKQGPLESRCLKVWDLLSFLIVFQS